MLTAIRSHSVFQSRFSRTFVLFLAAGLVFWTAAVARADDPAPTKDTPTKESTDVKKPGNDALLTDKDPAKKAETKNDEKTDDAAAVETPGNPGQADLDKATQLKVTAEGLGDLNEVVDKLDSAIEKGLDKDNKAFAEQLLISDLNATRHGALGRDSR